MTTPRGLASVRGRSGFSLIEVVVSIGIVGVALVAVGALVHTIPLSQQTRYETLALTIATDEIEGLRTGGYAAIPAGGPFTNTLMSSLPSGSGTLTTADYNPKTKSVTVTVSWQKPGLAARTISLSTLITQVGGLP